MMRQHRQQPELLLDIVRLLCELAQSRRCLDSDGIGRAIAQEELRAGDGRDEGFCEEIGDGLKGGLNCAGAL